MTFEFVRFRSIVRRLHEHGLVGPYEHIFVWSSAIMRGFDFIPEDIAFCIDTVGVDGRRNEAATDHQTPTGHSLVHSTLHSK